ncbi:MAG: hypothetical protein ACFE8G_10040 [Candidatus Hermodarchaeota archaeon]
MEKGLCDDHLMLIGDTGGFVSPISGEEFNTHYYLGIMLQRRQLRHSR